MPKIFVTFILSVIFSTAFAQNFTGKVVDGKNLPLADVYLQNNRTNIHAHTDDTGFFMLQDCKIGDSIRVTLIGFKSLTVAYSEQKSLIKLVASKFQLDEVVVAESINHLSAVSKIDLQTNPVNSAQELLRKVPGLFIGQHAGGGKAEQLFLRGFDLDHGTDINISVDQIPVNMVSHAHGQGYADLHFLIPETVEKIDYDKGPYHADKGNLATAGYVAFQTKDRLDENTVTLEGGKFNTFKGLGMFNIINNEQQTAYVAVNYLKTDGFFDASQNFKRLNLFGKYSYRFKNLDQATFSVSHFNSNWNASGQIPQRAVDQGLIGRFGAIDNNEGGKTARTNFSLKYNKFIDEDTWIKTNAYFSRYDFELYSNFSFFLIDPVNGDQIKQKEIRNTMGLESVLHKKYRNDGSDLDIQAGVGVRYDDIDGLELSHTVDRTRTISRIELGNVDEVNPYAFVNGEVDFGKLILNPAVRIDMFTFKYQDLVARTMSSRFKSILSPKLNFIYNQNQNLQFFLKLGKGFHSNDSRVSVTQRSQYTLPSAYGADLGGTWKPIPRLMVNAAVWYLYLEQEFVYSGDGGIVEASGRSSRKGVDLGLRYQLNNWLFLNGDATYNHGRFLDAPEGQFYIPLAPKFTFTGGLSVKQYHNFSGSINMRYLAKRPANADNSLTAKGYCITDANINYTWKRFTLGLITENVFNRAWNETQFATESKLKNETSPVTEINFTPGTPFNIRASLSVRF